MITNYTVHPIKAFNDNYLWAVMNEDSTDCVVVDPGSATEVLSFLNAHNLTLTAILVTHHHRDHIGGIIELKKHFPSVDVYGPTKEAKDVVNIPLIENDIIHFDSIGLSLRILDVPGHTLGHIAYVNDMSLFCGDTLFAAGCGRMFEGTPEMFSASLIKLKSLPEQTNIYCAHEYTLSNLEFAKAVEPQSSTIDERIKACQQQRNNGQPTLPSTISQELLTNPFFRLTEPAVVQSLNVEYGLTLADNITDNFALLRQWKDSF